MQGIHNRHLELSKRINDHLEENLDYMQQLFTQYSQPTSDAVITKTPRILRKRETKQRIETIPENDVFHQDDTSSHTTEDINQEEEETTEIVGGRSKRLASRKAASNIRKQSSIALREKLKRPASSEDHVSAKKVTMIYNIACSSSKYCFIVFFLIMCNICTLYCIVYTMSYYYLYEF